MPKDSRTERIAVKITPDLYDELVKLADEIGQPPSTLAAFYLCDMINKKRIERENNQRMAESVGIAFKEMFGPAASAMQQMMLSEFPEES